MFRDLDLYNKISISRKFEVVKFLTLLVNFENFEMVLPPRFSRYNISKTCFRHFYEFRIYVGTSEFIWECDQNPTTLTLTLRPPLMMRTLCMVMFLMQCMLLQMITGWKNHGNCFGEWSRPELPPLKKDFLFPEIQRKKNPLGTKNNKGKFFCLLIGYSSNTILNFLSILTINEF